MNNSAQHPKPAVSQKKLRYLRILQEQTGQTFEWPRDEAHASREIDRLKKVGMTSRSDRRRERRELQTDMASGRGDSSRVREDEVSGYGSSARWQRS